MTFLEAAIAVLRRVGRPLHYREITKLAIERDLLSHIGKMPEQAMQTRLSSAVRRRDPDATLVKVGPGTYSLGSRPDAEASRREPSVSGGPSAVDTLDDFARAHELEQIAPVEAGGAPEAVDAPTGPEPSDAADGLSSEAPPRARKRRRRRRRSKAADCVGGLPAALAHLIEARGRPIKVAELASSARAHGLIRGDARGAEEVVVSILRTEVALDAGRGRRPRFAFDGDRVELLDRAMGAETLDLERQVLAGAEQLADSARAQVAAGLRSLPLASVAAITRACLAADDRGDARLVSVVSDAEVRFECVPIDGGAALSVVLLKCDGDASELVERHASEARRAGHRSSILFVTTGTRAGAAVEVGAPQVEVWDAVELAARMERLGLGYRTTSLAMVFFDADFFRRLGT